jgi:hypothetical protein
VNCGKAMAFLLLALPGTGGVTQPRPVADGLAGPRAFQYASRIEEAPHAPLVGAGAAPPPNPPPRPASGSHRLPNTLGQVGEQYGPSVAPFVRARCPFSPLLRPYSPGGAGRGSHTGQFSCFGPRSCFIAFVLDIPNGFRPLDRAVGRAYIRETVANGAAWGRAWGRMGPHGAWHGWGPSKK